MAQQTINLGTAANDGTGTDLRTGGGMINDNFTELYAAVAAASAGGNALMKRISGNYYFGGPLGSNSTGSGAPVVTTTYWVPQIFEESVTLSEFGVVVQTGGGSVQVGLYARSATTGDPTGVCLAYTDSIDTSAGGNKSGAVAHGSLFSGGQAVIPAGEYFWGVQFNSTATRCVIPNTADSGLAIQWGTPTLSNLAGSSPNTAPCKVLTGGTYGTWPDVTSSTFTQTNVFTGARPLYKVA